MNMYSPKPSDHTPTSRSNPKTGFFQKFKVYRARMAEFQDNSPSSTIVKALVVLLLLHLILIGGISARTFFKGQATDMKDEINTALVPMVNQRDIAQPDETIPVAVPIDEAPPADLITQSDQVVDVRNNETIPQAEEIAPIPAPTQPTNTNRVQSQSIAKPGSARHTVRTGDTWSRIAKDNHVSEADLRAVNPKINNLATGSILVIPAKPGQEPIAVALPVRQEPKKGTSYAVKKGETLSSIARKHKVSVKDIQKLNNMSDKEAGRIKIGQQILIPGK